MKNEDIRAYKYAAETLGTCLISALCFIVIGIVAWIGIEKAFKLIASAFPGGN